MSHAVRIDAKFATAEDVASTLGVSPARAKKLSRLATSRAKSSDGSGFRYAGEYHSPKHKAFVTRDAATPISKSKVVAYLSDKVSTKNRRVSKKQVSSFFDELFNLARKQAKISRKLASLRGRAVKAGRKARSGRNLVIRDTKKTGARVIVRVIPKRRTRAKGSKSDR